MAVIVNDDHGYDTYQLQSWWFKWCQMMMRDATSNGDEWWWWLIITGSYDDWSPS